MNDYVVYTDGAYSPLRNKGGIGIVIIKDGAKILEFNKGFNNTTNNRMELLAVYYALSMFKKPINSIKIISDSQYVLGCITKNWKKRKNKDLWDKFDVIYENFRNKICNNIEWSWTKGHADDENNNLCDKLAVKASQNYEV